MIIKRLQGTAIEIESDKKTFVMEASEDNEKALVLTSSDESLKRTKTRVVSWPWEYEFWDWYFKAFETNASTTIFNVRVEDMYITHLGNIKNLSQESIDKLDWVDILILPVSTETLNAKDAKKISESIEPRIIIPVWDMAPNFIELMWVSADNESKAFVKISKSSLPTDKTEIIQLKRGE